MESPSRNRGSTVGSPQFASRSTSGGRDRVEPDTFAADDPFATARAEGKPDSGSHLKQIGPYRVSHFLGRGGMGEVFAGFDPRLERPVAIKRLLSAGSGGDAVEELRREARHGARLSHPNIVRLYDLVNADGIDYMVSELVDGESLDQQLMALPARRLPIERALEIAIAVTDALAYAHENGVVHRDVKAANVLIGRNGDIKLADFGIASRTRGLGSSSTPARSDVLSGTYYAMSPEQSLGDYTDARSDLFSLGVLIYELATGNSPFFSPEPGTCLKLVREARPLPLCEVSAEVPLALSRLVEKLLEKRREDRPESAREVKLTLEGISGELRAIRERSRRDAPIERQLAVACVLPELVANTLPHSEEARARLRLLELLQEAVQRAGGTLLTGAGPRLIFCIGYPRAQDNTCEVAVRLLLDLARQLAPEHAFAAAIDCGVVSLLQRAESVLACGEAIDRAVRVAAVTPSRAIAVTLAAQTLARRFFRFQPLASEDAPGEPLGTPTYVVTEMLSHDAGIEQVSTTPLRARARQLEQLERAFQDAQRGAVVTRLIVGIAGAGKSRMLHEWRRRSWQATDLLLTAYATVHEHHSPFAPLLRMWRSWFGFPLDDPPQAIRERLQTVLEQAELPVEKFAAPLAYAFGAGDDIVSKQPAERRRHLVIQAFVELTIALAEKRLVVLAFEDLHFVDRSTLDVLRRLVESARPARLLLVLTARPEFVAGWPLANRISRIDVTPLGQSDALQLVESMSQRSSLPTALVRRIVDLSDGVPLVLEELVRAALSDWERDGEVADLMSRPPTSFADSVARRIEELGRARDLIRVAALLGRETPVTILRAVMQIGDEEFLSRLRKLELADLVHLRDVSGEPCCVFAHILIQEAAKDAIPAETSGALHASIVQVLDRDFSDRVLRNPERFAHLYATAGACERALALFELAANRAARDSAHDEAAAHLQAALSLLQSRTDATDVAIERRLRGALGPCLMAIEGWSAGAVAENLNRSRSLGDEASELRELWGTWAHGLVTHDVATVRNALAAVNRATPGAEQRFAVLSMEGVTAFYRGQFASSRRYLEQAVAMLPPLEGDAASVTDERVSLANARSWGCEFVVAASMHLAWLEALSGRRERAEAVRANAEAILAHLSSDGELRETRHALYMQIHLGLTLRDYEYLGYSGLASGTGPLYRLFELAGGRFPYYRCVAQFGEARARAAGGDGSAIDDLLIVYERMKTISSRPTGHVFLASILAEACIEAGRLSEAERLLDEAMQVADTEFGRFYAPEAYRLAAECALALGELRVARKRVRQARTACLTLDVPLESPVLHFERNLARTEASLVERVPLSPHSSDVSAPSALDDGHVADAKAQEPERRAALDEP